MMNLTALVPILLAGTLLQSCADGSNASKLKGSRSPGDPFHTPHEAAINALSSIYAVSNNEGVEYGGFIYTDKDGTFWATTPHSQNSPCSLSVSSFPSIPAGLSKFALYHTHPYYNDSDAENLSGFPGDKFVASTYNLWMYVMTPSRAVKWFVPAAKTSNPLEYPLGYEVVLQPAQGPSLTFNRNLPAECD